MREGDGVQRPWRQATLFLLTASGVVLCFALIRTLLFPVVGAIVLAVGLRVPHRWLRSRISASLAATVLLTGLCVAVLLPGFFVVRSLLKETITTIHYVQSGRADDDLHRLTAKHHKVGSLVQEALDRVSPEQAGKRVATEAAVWIGRGLQRVVRAVTEIIVALFLLFFLLRDQETAERVLANLIPLGPDHTSTFLVRLGDLTYAIFVGRLLIAVVQGSLAGVAYWLLGVPSPLLWAVVTALFCLVPAFGAFIAWIPIALYLGLEQSWTKALILAIWGSLIVGNIDNVLYPMLVGRRTSLHTAVIFVGIFGGVALFGISGFVLGPVVFASTMLLLQAWRQQLGPASDKPAPTP